MTVAMLGLLCVFIGLHAPLLWFFGVAPFIVLEAGVVLIAGGLAAILVSVLRGLYRLLRTSDTGTTSTACSPQ